MIPRPAVRLICVAGLALCLFGGRVARAQNDATIEMARQRFKEGVQFYDQHNYEKARLAFLQAYALKPHPSVLLNLAQSELRSDHSEDAATHFAEYVRTNTEASDPEKHEAEVGFAAAKAKVAEVTVSVDVAGAQITVDNNERGVAPLGGPLYLAPGTHTVEAKSNDKHATKTMSVAAGDVVSANLTLHSSPPPAAIAAAPTSTGPQEPLPETDSDTADKAPEESAPPVEAAPVTDTASGGRKGFFEWYGETPLAWVTSGVGVLGVAGGLTFGLIANNDYSNANTLKSRILSQWQIDQSSFTPGTLPCSLPPNNKLSADLNAAYQQACSKYQSNANNGDKMKTLSIVSGIVGGVGIVGTVVYYFVDSSSDSRSAKVDSFQARVVPWTAHDSAGLDVVGRF
jgi:hypothetical protein